MGDAEQLALLNDRGRVHRFPMDTEAAAADSMAGKVKPLRLRVLELLRDHPGGLTDDEGAVLLQLHDRLQFGKRRQELCVAGLVHDSGRRRKNVLTGRDAAVWTPVATEDWSP